MPYYNENISRIVVPEGEPLVDLLINAAFDKSVLIKVYRLKNGKVKLFWNFEILFTDSIRTALLKLKGSDEKYATLPLVEIYESEDFRKEIEDIDITYSRDAGEKLIGLTEKLMSEGLPEVSSKPRGLDGYTYELTVYGKEIKKYDAWTLLPSEYGLLKSFTDEVINRAHLSNSYRAHLDYPVDEELDVMGEIPMYYETSCDDDQ